MKLAFPQADIRIEAVYLAQTHVMKPDQPYFRLTGNRDALPKALPSEPGVVQHRFEDSFTAMIPARVVRPGLSVEKCPQTDKRAATMAWGARAWGSSTKTLVGIRGEHSSGGRAQRRYRDTDRKPSR